MSNTRKTTKKSSVKAKAKALKPKLNTKKKQSLEKIKNHIKAKPQKAKQLVKQTEADDKVTTTTAFEYVKRIDQMPFEQQANIVFNPLQGMNEKNIVKGSGKK